MTPAGTRTSKLDSIGPSDYRFESGQVSNLPFLGRGL